MYSSISVILSRFPSAKERCSWLMLIKKPKSNTHQNTCLFIVVILTIYDINFFEISFIIWSNIYKQRGPHWNVDWGHRGGGIKCTGLTTTGCLASTFLPLHYMLSTPTHCDAVIKWLHIIRYWSEKLLGTWFMKLLNSLPHLIKFQTCSSIGVLAKGWVHVAPWEQLLRGTKQYWN